MYTTNAAYAQLNSASWKTSLQMAIWLVPIRRNILYLNRRTGRKIIDKKKQQHTAMIPRQKSTFAHARHKFKRVGKNPAYLPKSFYCLFSGQWLKPHTILLEPEWSFLVLWKSDFKHWKYLDSSPISCSFWILSQSNWWLQSHCNTDFLPWINTKHFLIRFLELGRISSLSILLTGTLKVLVYEELYIYF